MLVHDWLNLLLSHLRDHLNLEDVPDNDNVAILRLGYLYWYDMGSNCILELLRQSCYVHCLSVKNAARRLDAKVFYIAAE